MTKRYSAQVIEDTISLLNSDLRNLRSQTLQPYYTSDNELSDAALEDKADESREFRLSNGLKTIPTSELVSQIAQTNNRSLFLRLMRALGIEVEFSEDLISEPIGDQIPQLGDVTSFTTTKSSKGATLSIASIRSKLASLEAAKTVTTDSDENIFHVLEDDPVAVATEVVEINRKIHAMHDYVRAWLR